MKKLLLSILLLSSYIANAQLATGLNLFQANPMRTGANDNVVSIVYDGSQYRFYRWNKWDIIDTARMATKHDLSSYATMSSMSSALSSKMNNPIGTLSQYITGSGSLSVFPTNVSTFSNDAGYMTSFTEQDPTISSYAKSLTAFSVIKASTDVLYKSISYSPSSLDISTALGYTPYNSTNPSSYITQSGARGSISLSTTGSGAATYNSSTGVLNVPTPSISSYTAGTGISLASNVITNTAPDQTVALTAGNRINITGSYPNFTISYVEPSINQVSRTVNTNFTIGSRQATVMYSIPVTATNPLLAGTSVGSAFLEYSVNAGTTWTTALSTSASSQVGLAVAIALTTGGSNMLTGVVPANALVRIRSTTSGTATVGTATGQEVF